MGSHKHGVSGHPGRSPRFKFMRQLEDNKNTNNKPKSKKRYNSVAEAIKNEKQLKMRSQNDILTP